MSRGFPNQESPASGRRRRSALQSHLFEVLGRRLACCYSARQRIQLSLDLCDLVLGAHCLERINRFPKR
jgi:hypothetical protein